MQYTRTKRRPVGVVEREEKVAEGAIRMEKAMWAKKPRRSRRNVVSNLKIAPKGIVNTCTLGTRWPRLMMVRTSVRPRPARSALAPLPSAGIASRIR